MRVPRFSPVYLLLLLLALLAGSSMLYTRESLLFCEKALAAEMDTIAKESTADKPLSFQQVCPELRSRAENQLNRWLEVLLALMVQFTHPADRGPGPGP